MMAQPGRSNDDCVVGIEWHMEDLFSGTFDSSYAALAVLYHHRITQALFKYYSLPQRTTSSLIQRRFQVGIYYEVVSH